MHNALHQWFCESGQNFTGFQRFQENIEASLKPEELLCNSWSPVLHYLMSPLWPMSFLQKFHFFKSKIGNLSVVHKIRIEYIKPKLGISFGNSTANNKLSWDIFYIDTKNIEHQSWTRNIKNKVTIMYHHNHLYNIHVKNKIIINVTKAMPTKDLH